MVFVHVQLDGLADRTKIGLTGDASGGFLGPTDRRYQNRRQHPDDGNDHHQFEQGETLFIFEPFFHDYHRRGKSQGVCHKMNHPAVHENPDAPPGPDPGTFPKKRPNSVKNVDFYEVNY